MNTSIVYQQRIIYEIVDFKIKDDNSPEGLVAKEIMKHALERLNDIEGTLFETEFQLQKCLDWEKLSDEEKQDRDDYEQQLHAEDNELILTLRNKQKRLYEAAEELLDRTGERLEQVGYELPTEVDLYRIQWNGRLFWLWP